MKIVFNDSRFKRNRWTFNNDIPDLPADELKKYRDGYIQRIEDIQKMIRTNNINHLEPAELKSISTALEHVKSMLRK